MKERMKSHCSLISNLNLSFTTFWSCYSVPRNLKLTIRNKMTMIPLSRLCKLELKAKATLLIVFLFGCKERSKKKKQ